MELEWDRGRERAMEQTGRESLFNYRDTGRELSDIISMSPLLLSPPHPQTVHCQELHLVDTWRTRTLTSTRIFTWTDSCSDTLRAPLHWVSSSKKKKKKASAFHIRAIHHGFHSHHTVWFLTHVPVHGGVHKARTVSDTCDTFMQDAGLWGCLMDQYGNGVLYW